MSLVKELAQGLKHILFPALCEGCRKPLVQTEEVICLGCETYLSKTNYHHVKDNETALRISGRVPFLHATSLAYFTNESLLQHLIHGLKYEGKKQNGIFLGKELGRSIAACSWNIDVIIPVPLHPKKEANRGYNQSVSICEGIADILNVPVLPQAVVRNRFTESQTDKTREERISNVRHAFEVRKAALLKGKHVLLVDDVMTTGATIEACAEALFKMPNISLSIATAGIAN